MTTEFFENRHTMASYEYSFFVVNESGYDFDVTLNFEANWWNQAPGYGITVIGPDGRTVYKENVESVDYKDENVFHGPLHGPPDVFPPEPLFTPDGGLIFPAGSSESATVDFTVPATGIPGIYQIKICHAYTSINGEGRNSSVDLSLNPPLPYGWKGGMGITDLCRNYDVSAKRGTAYFCSLPPGILGKEDNLSLKQWFQARGLENDGKVGFRVKIFEDDITENADGDTDGILLKEFTIEHDTDANANDRRRSWRVHDIVEGTPMSILDYTVTGPDYLKNDPTLPRKVYRIEWENLPDDEDGNDADYGHTLLVETHEPTEVENPFPDEYSSSSGLSRNYMRQGVSDVPFVFCSDRNTAIKINNGIDYIYDDGLESYSWDTNRIVFLNSNQRNAWEKIRQAREEFKANVFDQGLVNTQDDPYWIGTPGVDTEGGAWDYGAAMQGRFKDNVRGTGDPWLPGSDVQEFWTEDRLNIMSNLSIKHGFFNFLPCHIFEQNMNPSSPWFGVFWNWHSSLFEDIQDNGGNHLDSDGNVLPLGNPYSSVHRYLYDPSGNPYSHWQKDGGPKFPRLHPTSGLANILARLYSIGDTRDTLGYGFLRDANPFYKNVGIRNRLVLALLQQLMAFGQNGDHPYYGDDYRGGEMAFATNSIATLIEVFPDIGTTDDDIFQGEEAEEVKDIIKTGIISHLESFAAYLNCSAHNQWLHAFPAIAKCAAYLNDSYVDFLMLRNVKVSDNKYNHGVPTWQESGGWDSNYCAFAIYSLVNTRGYLLQRRDNIKNNDEGSDILKMNELTLRDFERQVNDLTDFWNHCTVIDPDGTFTGCHDFNSRTDAQSWATSPRRFLEFIGKPYGDTIDIPIMDACHTLVAHTTGRQWETWNDMYRPWQHNVPDPYGVEFNFDRNNGDGASIEEKRDYVLNKFNSVPSGGGEFSPRRFRESFATNSDGSLQGLANQGINPCSTIAKPKEPKYMDKEDDTLSKSQGPSYARFGTPVSEIPTEIPPQLPAHRSESFVKLWPSFVGYFKNSENNNRVYVNQPNQYPDSSTRPNIGGVTIKTSKYYAHVHCDGWNLSNQKQNWDSRKNSNLDPEYLANLQASSGGFSLFATPEEGGVLVGKSKGFLGSNQIFCKKYLDPADRTDPNLGDEWNDAVEADGCGYAWARPGTDNAIVIWTPNPNNPNLGTLTHSQHMNYNILNPPTTYAYNYLDDPEAQPFTDIARNGGIGFIQRTYTFKEDSIDVQVIILPTRTVTWDEVYMTFPISIMGRGYNSGDGGYVQSDGARTSTNRKNIGQDFRWGGLDVFESTKGGCWKREVFPRDNKFTVGRRFFNPLGTEFAFDPGVVDRIERLVSGPGTDPLYPQTDPDTLIQDNNFLWPPTEEVFNKHLHLVETYGTVENLLTENQRGNDQTNLPLSWVVPNGKGYGWKQAGKTEPKGRTTDDSLKVQFTEQYRQWTDGGLMSFKFTVTPGKSLDEAAGALRLAGGTNNVARIPEEVQNDSLDTMYYVSDWVLGAVEDIDTFNSFTDAELLQKVDNHLNSDQSGTPGAASAPAILRRDYLNEETTGWIHLDIEEYINLNFISDQNPPDPIVYSEERLENWAIGVIRRINAFKIRCPNAKFSLWAFGSPQRAAHDDERFTRQKEKMLFVSNVSHDGQTLFDAVDFLSPVLYQKSEVGSSFEQRIENGERAQQCIEIVNALFEQHGEIKPVVPTFAFEYEGGSLENQNADRLNAIEMNILKDMPGFSHFQMWHAFYNELSSFEQKKANLLEAIQAL